MKNTRQWIMNSKVGPLYLIVSEEGLHGIYWKLQAHVPTVPHLKGKNPITLFLRKVVLQLEEYLDGSRTEFSLPLVQEGTPFQKKVWSQLSRIPYGKTQS